jgi:hypothetical protein
MVKFPTRVIAKMRPDGQQISLRNIIGEAIESYSQVEYLQIVLLESILEKPPLVCASIFKATQSVRARNGMFADLIDLKTTNQFISIFTFVV